MILFHLKQTFRVFLRNKLHFCINTLGFSIGLALVLLISSWAIYEHSFDKFHKNRQRIYRVVQKTYFPGESISYSSAIPEWMVNTFEKEIPEIEASTSLSWASNMITSKNNKQIEINNVLYADNKVFDVLTFDLVAGNRKNLLDKPFTVVLTQKTANKLFPGENPMGKTIPTENNKIYTVTGVVKDFPKNSHIRFNMLLSMEERKSGWNPENDYNHIASTYVLLKPNIKNPSLGTKLKSFVEKYMPKMGKCVTFELQPLSDVHLNSVHIINESINWYKFDNKYVFIYLLTAFLILIIVTANFINLSIANLSKRYREMSIRKIIGSGKAALIIQVLFEAASLLLISFFISIFFIHLLTPVFEKFLLKDQHIIFPELPVLLALTLSIFGIIILLVSAYPFIILSSLSPVALLKNKFAPGIKGETLRKCLTIGQFAITIALLTVLLVLNKQVKYIKSKNLGFSTDQTILLPTNNYISNHLNLIKEELQLNPEIKGVTFSNTCFANNEWGNRYEYEGQPVDKRQESNYMFVDEDFLDVYKIPILKGYDFSSVNVKNRKTLNFIINESLAKQLNCSDPIGKKFRLINTDWGEIIGIVKDFHFKSLHQPIGSLIMANAVIDYGLISVKINNNNNIQGTIKFLESKWSRYDPNHSFNYSFLDEVMGQFYEKERGSVKLFISLTFLSIFLSVMGLYGMVLIMIEKATKEIGIRKVNGAKVSEVLAMLNKDFIKWVVLAFIIACPIAWYAMYKWLQNFAYKTELSWWVFALAGIVAVAVAVLTVSWQSFKAATRNPVQSLRYE